MLHVDHVFVAQAIQLTGGNSRLDEWRDVIQHFGSELSCNTHLFDFIRGFDANRHVRFLPENSRIVERV
jgi:hypothetical protein